jgi:type II secretory pathway component PulC
MLITTLTSCASRKFHNNLKHQEYQVSVVSDGEPVKDFEQKLVLRVELPESVLDKINPPNSEIVNIPFNLTSKLDEFGEPMGVLLASQGTTVKNNPLKLVEDDLLTAINQFHVRYVVDISYLFQSLRLDKRASITLQRYGKPMKIYYYLKDK